eukprot:Hpha_TRINITY_DN16658_c4_g1::TRINITY_DN16658_c4_g1_i1::g.183513::m.183513
MLSMAVVILGAHAASQCTLSKVVKNRDLLGKDLQQKGNITLDDCASLCCDTSECKAYVYVSTGAPNWGNCIPGLSCCYLKETDTGDDKEDSRHSFGLVSRSESTTAAPSTPAPSTAAPSPAAPVGPGTRIVWTGVVGDEQWTTANNWYPAQVPGKGDTVVIDDADRKNAVVVLTRDTAVKALQMGQNVATSAKLRLLAALEVSGSVSVSYNGEIEINSGKAALSTPKAVVQGKLSFLSGLLQGDYNIPGSADFGGKAAQGSKLFRSATVQHTGKGNVLAGGSWQFAKGSKMTTTAGVEASGSTFQLIIATNDTSTGNGFVSPGFNWTQ